MKKKQHSFPLGTIFLIIIANMLIVSLIPKVQGYYHKQEFSLNNETRTVLDEEEASDTCYNGTISVTVTEGGPVVVTVSDQKGTINISQTRQFLINKTNRLFFKISAEGVAKGFFELDFDVYIPDDNRAGLIAVLAVGAMLILIPFSYTFFRSKKEIREPGEEEEELEDEELLRKRREAAAAEKRYWGLDD